MNKPLIGCVGVLLIVCILAGILILDTPQFLEAGKKGMRNLMAEETRISALEADWQPPQPSIDAKWFSGEVGEWKLEKAEASASIPALGLDRAGYVGSYRSNRGQIEVNIVPVSEQEKTTVVQNAQDSVRGQRDSTSVAHLSGVDVSVSREASRVTTSRGNRTHIRVGLSDHTRLWWLKGYLFVFRAQGSADSDAFPEEFIVKAGRLAAVESAPK